MNTEKVSQFVNWYEENRGYYEELVVILKDLLEDILEFTNRRQSKKIDYYSVLARCKDVASFRDKLRGKNYPDDYQAMNMDDLVGARIIGYSKYDVDNVVDLIKENFKVLKIEDKQLWLGKTRTGYQSIHVTASLSDNQFVTHRHEKYKDVCFEIQVRTLLQEAWAALNHKKTYKFKGYLPSKIERKINLFSGVMELLDDELEGITHEVLNLISGLNAEFKKIENEREEIAHFLYTLKIISDLSLENSQILGNPEYLQKEVSNTTYAIQAQYSADTVILERWINDKFQAYDISLNQIDFSDKVKPKLIEFIRRELKVVLKQGNNRSPELVVTRFSTIWRGLHSFHEESEFPMDSRYTLRRDEVIELEPRSEFILQVGVVDAYLYGQKGERIQIHQGGSILSCKDVPPGEYNLLIKTEYEPSNDGMADFVDRVKVT